MSNPGPENIDKTSLKSLVTFGLQNQKVRGFTSTRTLFSKKDVQVLSDTFDAFEAKKNPENLLAFKTALSTCKTANIPSIPYDKIEKKIEEFKFDDTPDDRPSSIKPGGPS